MTCELCGGADFSTHLPAVRDYISDETFAIRRCNACSLCVTDPLIPDNQIARYYPARYRVDRQKQTGSTRVKLRANAIKRPPARLLDLGCGTGAFAMEMKRRGWDVAVTELNDEVLDSMRSQGMEAKRPDQALRDGFAKPFDVITAWHVLEHVEHPKQLAAWSRANVEPGGIFQVTVPGLSSWQARMFDKDWLHLDVPRHRYHFTPQTLTRLLAEAGFEIERTSTFAFEYDLFGFIQSALNRVCRKPNVLFERLTRSPALQAGAEAPDSSSPRDIILSYALLPLMMSWSLPLSLASALLHRGATLTATACVSQNSTTR